MSTDLENIDTGVNSKAKSHVTLRRAVLEEIGNRVTTRATQVAKVRNMRTACVPTEGSIAVLPYSHFFFLVESSEHESTCSTHQNNKCQQTAETRCFCETSTDENVGSKGREF